MSETKSILALDIGSTNIKVAIVNENAEIIAIATQKIEILSPQPGAAELEPERLWKQITSTVQEVFSKCPNGRETVKSVAITGQRGTFTLWRKDNGQALQNFIMWNDTRCEQFAATSNSSMLLKAFHGASACIRGFTGSERFKMASRLKFSTQQVAVRLAWVFSRSPEYRQLASENNLCFGCIETWLLWKLTGGKVHATDHSFASATGLYDPFLTAWSSLMCRILFDIPMSILPEIRDSSGDYGVSNNELLGFYAPVSAVIGDQQASLFGLGCFRAGELKCSFGTGTFMCAATGDRCVPFQNGLYSMAAWKIGQEIAFMIEGNESDTGHSVEWAVAVGWAEDLEQSSAVAQSVSDSNGVFFVPGFGGLHGPICDDSAACLVIGMTPQSTKAHMARAVLEGIAFRVLDMLYAIEAQTKLNLGDLRVDGGMSKNDFLMQFVADLLHRKVHRMKTSETCLVGAALLAGLSIGLWKDRETAAKLVPIDKTFYPQPSAANEAKYQRWQNAVERSKLWHRKS